jgi:hypothetical protein
VGFFTFILFLDHPVNKPTLAVGQDLVQQPGPVGFFMFILFLDHPVNTFYVYSLLVLEKLLKDAYLSCTAEVVELFVGTKLKLNAREKTLHAGEKFEDFETYFRINWC